jgi:hypothetical protein
VAATIIIEESVEEVVESENTAISAPTLYTIQAPASVKSGKGAQRVAIDVLQLTADMIYHCVPSVDAAAYLTVRWSTYISFICLLGNIQVTCCLFKLTRVPILVLLQ